MSAASWVGLTVFLLMVYGLYQLGRRRELSEKDFEREARRPSLLGTGLQEFQGLLEPEKKAAIQSVREEKRKTKPSLSGERPVSGPAPAHRGGHEPEGT